jgi:hypothetical protein
VLLSDEKVREFLSSQVVPVWESVRPVPKVTIDFGDGSVLKRTLKGNTVMFLCDVQGRVVDAFPGVYTPKDFLAEVAPAVVRARSADRQGDAPWHRSMLKERIKVEGRSTMAKAFIETPLLNALGLRADASPRRGASLDIEVPDNRGLSDAYRELVERIEDLSARPLHANTLRRELAKSGVPKGMTEEQLELRILELDSNQSVALFRPAVHLLLASETAHPKPQDLSRRIFKEILHVDLSDPYLGLADSSLPGTGTPPARAPAHGGKGR